MGLLTAQQGRERKEKKTRTLSTETTKSVQTFLRKLLCICLVHGFDLVYGTKLFCNFYQQRAHTNSKDTTALSKPFYVNRSKKTRQFFLLYFHVIWKNGAVALPEKNSYCIHAACITKF